MNQDRMTAVACIYATCYLYNCILMCPFSHVVGPRHPFRKDPDLDYEIDSDEEWEEVLLFFFAEFCFLYVYEFVDVE